VDELFIEIPEGKGTWRFFNQYCHAGGKNGKKSTQTGG